MLAQYMTIVVNSSDGFEDCWNPFFTLLQKYWTGEKPQIILNTESKEYVYKGLDIHSSRVGLGSNRKLTWSECLMKCLNNVETDYVLYLQEDYFINNPIKLEYIKEWINIMRQNDIACIRLNECDNSGPWESSGLVNELWKVSKESKYLVSLQAALWNRMKLLDNLRSHENAWEHELYGTIRMRRKKDGILCVNRDMFVGENAVVPYTPTGIVKGKWNKEAVLELFHSEGIQVDYGERGFLSQETTHNNTSINIGKVYRFIRSMI